MKEENNFKNTVLEEVGLLLDLPISSKKVQIFSKDDCEENNQLRHYNLSDQSILIVPPSLMDAVITATKKASYNEEDLLEYLKKALDLRNHSFTDETAFLFLNPKNYSLSSLDSAYEISQVEDIMVETFKTFTKGCSQADLDEGLVSLDDSLVFGCFHKNKLVGVASYWFLTDHLADIGVIVHPNYRRKGIGKALVSKLSQWGIDHGKINMYRYDTENEKSRKLAFSLGFEKYVNLKVMKEKNDKN